MTSELLTGLFLNKAIVISIDVIAILLAILVYKNNPKGKINRVYFVMTVLMMIWINGAYFPRIIGQEHHILSLYLLRIAWFASPLFVAFLNLLTSLFLGAEQKFRKMNRFILLLGTLTAVISSSSLAVSDFLFKGDLLSIVYGPFMLFYLVIILFMISTTVIQIIKYRKNFRKSNLKYFLIGLMIFYLFNGVFNIALPIFLNVSSLYFFGDYSTLVLLSLTTYAIVRHKLMDIRMVVARSVTYLLLLITIVAIAGVFMTLLPNYLFSETTLDMYGVPIRSAVGVSLAFLFQPLKRLFTKVTDKIFFKGAYDLQKVIKNLTDTINATLNLINLLYKTTDILIKEIKVSRGFFVLLDEKGSVFTTQSVNYDKHPKISNKEIVNIAKKGITIFDELTEGNRAKTLLRKFDASVSLGFIADDGRPMGVLFLGEKESGDMFSAKDVKLFEILMPELSIAIHRAREHEKISKFNIVLQQEVARQTKELSDKNSRLKELDKAKDEFISMASHQLRTPLTAIKGYLSMLLEGDAGEIKMAQYDFVTEAYNGASRMVGLINDLLNVSRMETGRFFIEPVDVDIETMVNEEIKQLANHAKDKKLYLKLEKKKPKIPKVRADETKLRQVVMNFIDNALYYTQKGGVTVILDADSKNLIFKVKDTGMGVPEAQQKNLFTKFYRADNARRARPDGTGLGIYLAKKVMTDHHGQIIFESEEGKGSTFGFKMPLKAKFSKELTTPPPDLAIKSEHKEAQKKQSVEKPVSTKSGNKEKALVSGKNGKKEKSALF